jgi:hypothetical protein
VLLIMTSITFAGYIAYLLYAIVVFDNIDKKLPSMSGMIAYSRGTTITFTLLVFVHSYAVWSYIVIISEYIGVDSYQFMAIAVSSVIYLTSLIVLTYLPLDGNENPHNIFALTGFIFALMTSLLHKHSFIKNGPGGWPTLSIDSTERPLVVIELVMITIILVSGILFWTQDMVIAEYVFIGLILLDKEIKVNMLLKYELINLDNAFIKYSYRCEHDNRKQPPEESEESKFLV